MVQQLRGHLLIAESKRHLLLLMHAELLLLRMNLIQMASKVLLLLLSLRSMLHLLLLSLLQLNLEGVLRDRWVVMTVI